MKSKPDVAQRHGPDLKPNRWSCPSGHRELLVAAPDGALLNCTDNVCHGFAMLRHEVLLWMPE